jgi:hypothetical protein
MLDDVFVLNEPVCGGCAHPVSGGMCTCSSHKQHTQHQPRPHYLGAMVGNIRPPEPLGQPEWTFNAPAKRREREAEPETQELVLNRPSVGLGEPEWHFANPMDVPKPQAAVPTRNRAAGTPEPMPQFEWNW